MIFRGIGGVLNNIGAIHEILGNNREALSYMMKAYSTYQSIENDTSLI